MKRIGVVFPGQGSQHIGMGKKLYDRFPEVKELFKHCLLYTSDAADE